MCRMFEFYTFRRGSQPLITNIITEGDMFVLTWGEGKKPVFTSREAAWSCRTVLLLLNQVLLVMLTTTFVHGPLSRMIFQTIAFNLYFFPHIYRFTVARICVQHSFSTTITTNGGAAQVRGNFANQWAVFWNRRESVNMWFFQLVCANSLMSGKISEREKFTLKLFIVT